jgi:DNA-binding MarR family transcriptional regulator
MREETLDQLISNSFQIKQLFAAHAHACLPDERLQNGLQSMALGYLEHHSAATVTELADALQVSASSATQLVERLVRDDLVSRSDDQDDRRVTRLHTTDAGSAAHERNRLALRGRVAAALEGISDTDLSELIRLHGLVIAQLKSTLHL